MKKVWLGYFRYIFVMFVVKKKVSLVYFRYIIVEVNIVREKKIVFHYIYVTCKNRLSGIR